jgi:hypothetical protein
MNMKTKLQNLVDNTIWWSLDKQTCFLVFFVGLVFGAVLF